MVAETTHAHIITQAERLLTAQYAATVRLALSDELSTGNIVLRCHVVEGPDELAAHIIVKHGTKNDQHCLNETMALRVFADTGVDAVPRLLAADPAERLTISADLGDHPSLQDFLYMAENGDTALDAVSRYGRALGRFHAQTAGHIDAFRAAQSQMGVAPPPVDAAFDPRPHADALRDCLHALEITAPAGFLPAFMATCDRLHGDPETHIHRGPFTVVCHNDMGDHNTVLTADDCKLLDFEFAGVNHALMDACGPYMAMPAAYHGRAYPAAALDVFTSAYREALAVAIPATADDALFMSALHDACIRTAFGKMIGFWMRAAQDYVQDGLLRPSADARPGTRYFIRRVRTYMLCLQAIPTIPAMFVDLAARIEAHIGSLWPTLPPFPTYPAFDPTVEPHL